jgi:hypothetical protein
MEIQNLSFFYFLPRNHSGIVKRRQKNRPTLENQRKKNLNQTIRMKNCLKRALTLNKSPHLALRKAEHLPNCIKSETFACFCFSRFISRLANS